MNVGNVPRTSKVRGTYKLWSEKDVCTQLEEPPPFIPLCQGGKEKHRSTCRLLGQVVTVSLETVKIVKALPELEEIPP